MSSYDNQWKEQFSIAYLQAVSSQAGWKVAKWNVDIDLVDATIQTSIQHTDGTNSDYRIDLQLKCIASPTTNNNEFISYSIDKNHIDKIKSKTFIDPFYFILFHIPKNQKEWIEHEKHGNLFKTILKYCGYYYEIDSSNKDLKSSSTIRFKKEAIFNRNFLSNLISGFETQDEYMNYKYMRLQGIQKNLKLALIT